MDAMKYHTYSHHIQWNLWLLLFLLPAAFQSRTHVVHAFCCSQIISRTITTGTTTRTTPAHPNDVGTTTGGMMRARNDESGDGPQFPKVQFTSISTPIPTNASPVDVVLSWLTSDIGSIVLGGVGLVLLLLGRFILDEDGEATVDVSPEVMVEQTRVNLLAVFAIGAVLLNGLSQLDVQSALAEKVDLLGTTISQPIIVDHEDYDNIREEISWVLSSILTATPARTVILLVRSENDNGGVERWKPIAYVGVLPPNMFLDQPQFSRETPIMDRMLRVVTTDTKRRESYLPTLQALPGRIEFTNYLLPSNTQAALLLPLRLTTSKQIATLLLGSNQARSFTPRDITWSQTVATRLLE
jgi:hypothetical protein